jgi:hypothetical protein
VRLHDAFTMSWTRLTGHVLRYLAGDPPRSRTFSGMKLPLADRLRLVPSLLPALAPRQIQWALRGGSLLYYVRVVDDKIDGDRPLPDGWTRERYLLRCRDLYEAIADLGSGRDPELWPEDILLVYAMRAARRYLALDIRAEWLKIWMAFETDCWREIRPGQHIPTKAVMDDARIFNVGFMAISSMLAGSDRSAAYALWTTFNDGIVAGDALNDLLVDMGRGSLTIADYDWGTFDPMSLLHCRTWEDLEQVPGFSDWAAEFVARHSEAWHTMLPGIYANLQATLPCVLLRVRTIQYADVYSGIFDELHARYCTASAAIST